MASHPRRGLHRVYNKKWGARIFIKRRTGILPVIFLSGFMDLAALSDDAEADQFWRVMPKGIKLPPKVEKKDGLWVGEENAFKDLICNHMFPYA
jgi:hypothetical protein